MRAASAAGPIDASTTLPAPFLAPLRSSLDRAIALVELVSTQRQETLARQAATALYDVSSAVLLAWEGTRPRADARRALLSRFVLTHRLAPADPLAPEEAAWEAPRLPRCSRQEAGLAEAAPMLGWTPV
jgi:hypothetical protein